eukprot:3077313-Pyramimonas_sp.AAC.1
MISPDRSSQVLLCTAPARQSPSGPRRSLGKFGWPPAHRSDAWKSATRPCQSLLAPDMARRSLPIFASTC